MKKLLKICATALMSLSLLTGCSFIEKVYEYQQQHQQENPGSNVNTGEPSSTDKDLDNKRTFCANAVNKSSSYSYTKTSVMNLSTISGIYDKASKATVVVNACYSVNGSEYNYITSGFVYEKEEKGSEDDYYILTNASGIFHRYYNMGPITSENIAIAKEGDFEITFDDGRRYVAYLSGSYDPADVAVFKLKTSDELDVIDVGNSDELEIGDSVLAIGTPSLGTSLINTLVRGNISGLERRQLLTYSEVINGISRSFDVADYAAFQFDAPVNAGMEGGPVLNSDGECVGMICYKFQGATSNVEYESLSMAIPINNIKNVIENIKKTGEYAKPVIGITISDIATMSLEQRSYYEIPSSINTGTYIVSISENSGAAKAGMIAEECIVKFDGKEVVGLTTISGTLLRHNSGDIVTIETVDFNGNKHSYRVTL